MAYNSGHPPGMHPNQHLPAIGSGGYQHPGQPLPPMAPAYGNDFPPPDQVQAQPPQQRGQTPRDEEGRPLHISSETQRRLDPVSKIEQSSGRQYRLDVVQQPRRARMCGFGDKDRRPITPPPCVRLIVLDPTTGKEIDCNEIEHSMYVLNVDLWSEDAMKEVSLVRSSSPTPSISSTVPASYSSISEASYQPQLVPSNTGYPHGMHFGGMHPGGPYMQAGYSQPGYGAPQPSYGPPQGYFPGQDGGFLPSQPMGYSGGRGGYEITPIRSLPAAQGMFTRNLIGSLAASAFRLTDENERIGIWFILQDLSVRTEGHFRLRFSFVNVAPPTPTGSGAMVNTGKAPVLASCFSDVFTVYSAKKFPGVWESTTLSKTFASQGIKIPIRKEGANNKANEDDDGD